MSTPWEPKTPKIDSLNLAIFGGDAKNGVGFFTGIHEDTPNEWHSYAGLFSDTNLGAPIATGARSLNWSSKIKIVGDIIPGGAVYETDFHLNIKVFADGDGRISAFFQPDSSNDNYFKIFTFFDTKGIIHGTRDLGVTYGKFRDNNANTPSDGDTGRYYGTLTGLIGTEGLVGAFVASAVSGTNEFRGGFVARDPDQIPPPPVKADYLTWLRGVFIDGLGPAAACPEAEVSKFMLNERDDKSLKICGLGAKNEGLDRLPTLAESGDDKLYQREFVKTASELLGPTKIVGGFTHNHVLWKGGGVRWNDYATTNRKNEVQEDYSYHTFNGSLHSDTDVGVVLPAGTFEGNATAKWKGYLAAEGTSKWLDTWSVNTAITPTIDFVNRTITIPQAGGTGNGNERLTFNNMIFNEDGFITGYVDAPYNLSFGTAPIRGIIGQNGLVGVFIQYFEKHHGYAGGIVACPTADAANGTGACK